MTNHTLAPEKAVGAVTFTPQGHLVLAGSTDRADSGRDLWVERLVR